MQLIPQDQTNACWYASALMVLQWSRRGELMSHSRESLISPTAHPSVEATYRANNGLQWSAMRRLARQLGLRELPLMSPSAQLLEQWLRSYGPVWTDGVPVDRNGRVAGTGHVVVLAGIRSSARTGEDYDLKIYDPWPPNRGDVRWRPGSHLATITSGVAENTGRNVCFLVKGT
ncbi:MAG: papain-like cysteine protease family protein [Pseudomonadota bacterium]|nr:papain-like cysteine protease family protein [Pseudomonadota bacterium]